MSTIGSNESNRPIPTDGQSFRPGISPKQQRATPGPNIGKVREQIPEVKIDGPPRPIIGNWTVEESQKPEKKSFTSKIKAAVKDKFFPNAQRPSPSQGDSRPTSPEPTKLGDSSPASPEPTKLEDRRPASPGTPPEGDSVEDSDDDLEWEDIEWEETPKTESQDSNWATGNRADQRRSSSPQSPQIGQRLSPEVITANKSKEPESLAPPINQALLAKLKEAFTPNADNVTGTSNKYDLLKDALNSKENRSTAIVFLYSQNSDNASAILTELLPAMKTEKEKIDLFKELIDEEVKHIPGATNFLRTDSIASKMFNALILGDAQSNAKLKEDLLQVVASNPDTKTMEAVTKCKNSTKGGKKINDKQAEKLSENINSLLENFRPIIERNLTPLAKECLRTIAQSDSLRHKANSENIGKELACSNFFLRAISPMITTQIPEEYKASGYTLFIGKLVQSLANGALINGTTAAKEPYLGSLVNGEKSKVRESVIKLEEKVKDIIDLTSKSPQSQ